MSVSRSPAPSSIDLSGVPARVAEAVAQVVAVCHEQFRSDPCPEAFEEAELRVRETMNALACELLGAVIEKRDDGASRIERDGQSWFRVAATPRTIMTSLGPLTYRRARYRSGASGSSPGLCCKLGEGAMRDQGASCSPYDSALARRSCSHAMASVRAHGPRPKARSTIRASPTMPPWRANIPAWPLRSARITSKPLIVA